MIWSGRIPSRAWPPPLKLNPEKKRENVIPPICFHQSHISWPHTSFLLNSIYFPKILCKKNDHFIRKKESKVQRWNNGRCCLIMYPFLHNPGDMIHFKYTKQMNGIYQGKKNFKSQGWFTERPLLLRNGWEKMNACHTMTALVVFCYS